MFTHRLGKATLTECPLQQKWFNMFLRGAESRMGHKSMANRALTIDIILRVLELIKIDMNEQSHVIAREYCKLGAAVAIALCGSLRGPEVFMLDLAGLRAHLSKGGNGLMPANPLKVGTDLTKAPHVVLSFIGKFKGETGVDKHLLAIASTSVSGVESRWWIERLVEVQQLEGCTAGPAFGDARGRVGTI